MSWLEGDAFEQMYERAGFMSTEDGALVVLAGSTLGGGKLLRLHTPELLLSATAVWGWWCVCGGGPSLPNLKT
jgi:hypothetical protein